MYDIPWWNFISSESVAAGFKIFCIQGLIKHEKLDLSNYPFSDPQSNVLYK
jgi:hypothetical protein